MKIEIDDGLFMELAEKLKTTPENTVKVFLDHANNLSHSIVLNAVQDGSSLDNALDKLMKNAEISFTMGSLFEEIIGDRNYEIGDGGYDLKEGIIYFHLSFLEGGDEEMDAILLQFGRDSGEVIEASISDLVLDKEIDDFLDDIYLVLDDLDEDYNFTYEWIDGEHLTFMLQIDTYGKFDLPKLDYVDGLIKQIKKIIIQHDSRKKLS